MTTTARLNDAPPRAVLVDQIRQGRAVQRRDRTQAGLTARRTSLRAAHPATCGPPWSGDRSRAGIAKAGSHDLAPQAVPPRNTGAGQVWPKDANALHPYDDRPRGSVPRRTRPLLRGGRPR